MWQSLGSLVFGEGHALQILLVVAAFVVLAAILFVLYRVLFAHRLRTPGVARGRAPRLGIVDVFELDGQRQLVIVRRDNVEHLLMIGGPNDVVVEGNIVRAAAANGVNGREGAKQPASNPAAQAQRAEPIVEAPAAATVPRPAAPAAAGLLRRSIPRRADVAAPPAAESPAVALAEVEAKPEPAKPLADTVIPLPLRPAGEPAQSPKPPAEPPIASRPAAEAAPPRRPLPPPKPVEPAPRPSLPSPITPLRQRAASSDSVRAMPSQGEQAGKAPPVEAVSQKLPESAAAPPVIAPPPVVVAPAPPPPEVLPTPVVAAAAAPDAPPSEKPAAPRRDEPFYDLESLEAEMARLLGRDS